jgi:hypothetical protein
MRSIFRRTTHFFKERAPELHVAYRFCELSPEDRRMSRFMALHPLRIACPRGEAAYCSDSARELVFL